MKHLYYKFSICITLSLISICAAASDYVPIVEIGKTWWYHSYTAKSNDYYQQNEFGITLKDSNDVDGILWTSCYMFDEQCNISAEPIAWLREENQRVYVKFNYDWDFQTNEPYCFMYHFYETTFGYYDENTGMLIYNFNLCIGDICDTETNLKGSEVLDITMENTPYGDYRCTHFNSGHYYEGIGVDSSTDISALTVITPFFPFPTSISGKASTPTLRWVTDANNTIIFQCEGGTKLWEQAGVSDIAIEGSFGTPVYYNLQGVMIPAGNLTPGVYVKVIGNKAEKVIVK